LATIRALRVVRVLGMRGAVLEGLRRIGVLESYRLGGIRVSSSLDFRALRMLREAGIRVEAVDNGLIARLEGYVLWAPEPAYFEPLVDIVKYYGLLEVEGKTVLDVGAYIGDTPLYFLARGAARVIAYEPVFHEIARRNIEANKAEDRVTLIPKGVTCRGEPLLVEERYGGTGWGTGEVKINTDALEEILESLPEDTAVKMDCEGCEHALQCIPCEVLARHSQYLVETHGPDSNIISHARNCGFQAKRVKKSRFAPAALWLFTLAP